MLIPNNTIVNADDLGLRPSINQAIFYCFEHKIINSTSLITNTKYFEETVNLIHENPAVCNLGVHINLAEGKPLTNFNQLFYLDENGNWDLKKINKKINFLNSEAKNAFSKEIFAQIDKALSIKKDIIHLDSHYHLHTLPCFYKLFFQASKHYKLKLRLAQTYNEGSYLKFLYRKYINNLLIKNQTNYSDYFETAGYFLNSKNKTPSNKIVEIMLHPDINSAGELIDHYDNDEMLKWKAFLEK